MGMVTVKHILVIVLGLFVSGCYQDYLDDPFYNSKKDTAYPIRMKDNAFVGVPTMTGDLIGCIPTLPFYPIYAVMSDKYMDDQESTHTLKSIYGFVPRVVGWIVGAPFRLVKWTFFDIWFKPGY